MQPMADTHVSEKAAEITIVIEERILVADRQHDIHLPQLFQSPVGGEARQEMRWRVEIDRVVVITVEKIGEGFDLHRQVIAAGKGHQLAEEMRVAEDEAGGLECAEAAAVDDGAFVAVAALHQRQNLVQHIFLESDMAADAIGRMAAEVVEGLAREALDAEQLQLTGLELVGEAGNDTEMFIFPKAPFPRWEHQYFGAGMPEHQKLHVTMEPIAVPAQIFSVHRPLKNRPTRSRSAACCTALSA